MIAGPVLKIQQLLVLFYTFSMKKQENPYILCQKCQKWYVLRSEESFDQGIRLLM